MPAIKRRNTATATTGYVATVYRKSNLIYSINGNLLKDALLNAGEDSMCEMPEDNFSDWCLESSHEFVLEGQKVSLKADDNVIIQDIPEPTKIKRYWFTISNGDDVEYNMHIQFCRSRRNDIVAIHGEDGATEINDGLCSASFNSKYRVIVVYTEEAAKERTEQYKNDGYDVSKIISHETSETYFMYDSTDQWSSRYSTEQGLVNVGTWQNSIHSSMGPSVWTTPENQIAINIKRMLNNKRNAEHSNSYYSQPWV